MKVLVADKFEKSGLDGLAALGCEVISNPDLNGDSLRDELASTQAEVLIVRSTKVTADMIDASSLKVIIRAGAGYNTIDVAAASAKGVRVANCPGMNAAAVAELAFALILGIDRHVADNVAQFNAGTWNKKGFGKANGVKGQTLGLIGFGSIGKEMVPRAKAFGMNVLVFSGHLSDADTAAMGVSKAASLTDLAAKSDVVSLHVSMRPDTKGLVNADVFNAMKPGATFINTSRCETVDEEALIAAVKEGRIRAGLDVFNGEPATADGEVSSPLQGLKGCYVTHHIGASTNQAQEAVAEETVRIVKVFKESGDVPNCVNPA